ncbi:F-box/LRR-repeat protein 3 isoform X1 [Triticum urartu]|uniref:F-box/LRR-repeat protein 15-like leucin rich repeat domain-containing protein n=1 Tax=Triticum urartu TaxID=4572 RepID=A0A8R7UFC9_TRIUA|nr:F-box/LRR-repeat protein 3-like [Triticum dicoccoides]XP_048528728.1 F-box/LRR-repeat protein 3 isoform X1 [Triticum urartu]
MSEEEAQRYGGGTGGGGVGALSVDLLGQVLDRVLERRDRKACRLVSRAFARAEAAHRRALRVLRREPLPRLLRAFPALERLDLSACASLDDASLAAALAGADLGTVRQVCLARASGVGWRGLEALVAACPRLEAVDLSHCVGAGDREAAALAAASGLRELNLEKCLGVTDMGLAKVAVGCPRLENLSFKWCREISDIGVDLLVKKCRELRSLDISYLKVSNESLRSISTLEKLEELAMVACSCIDDEGLELLSRGSNSLQSVDVSRCDHVTSQGLASLIDGHSFLQKLYAADSLHEIGQDFLSKLVTLKATLTVLRLDGFEVSSSLLSAIGEGCTNLVEIGLSKCNGVTDEGISSLVACCSYLRTIDLTCCNLVTNNSLDSIADNCKMLECLRLESCSSINEKGLERIASCCPNLKEIDLTDCGVNDEALHHLAKCSELLILKLGLSSSISDKGLGFISSKCGKLVELDLYRCSSITDDGLAALANGCKKIKLLNLCYCNKITDSGLSHLGALEELTNLELRCLVRITGIGISSVVIGCKSLVELDLKRCYSVDDSGLWALARYALNLRQLTISYCQVTGLGLCHLLSSLRCLQDVKMVHLSWVSIEGFEMALRAACGRLKKLKILSGLKTVLSPDLLQLLQACGCRIRWVNKPLVYKDAI